MEKKVILTNYINGLIDFLETENIYYRKLSDDRIEIHIECDKLFLLGYRFGQFIALMKTNY